MEEADLVVSHAGAGTCLEVCDLGRPLIAVVNSSLMDNHQGELAAALDERGVAVCASSPDELPLAISRIVAKGRPRMLSPRRGDLFREHVMELLSES